MGRPHLYKMQLHVRRHENVDPNKCFKYGDHLRPGIRVMMSQGWPTNPHILFPCNNGLYTWCFAIYLHDRLATLAILAILATFRR